MKRILVLTLSLILLFTALPVAPAVAAEQIVATEEDIILLAGSDFQVGNVTYQIEKIFTVLELHGLTKADGAFFVGDYTAEVRESNTSGKGIEVLKKLYQPLVGDNMLFTQGNHDPADTEGLAPFGINDPVSGDYGVFVINEDSRMDYNWDDSYDKTKEAADALKYYLDIKAMQGFTKPIFVLNHIGLHWGNRTGDQGTSMHAELLVQVLNEAGAKGLNIIYLYGHNHSSGYDDAMGGAAVYFKKGDQIDVPDSSEFFVNAHQAKKKRVTYTINFTYMNAGYIGAYSTTQPDTDAAVTISVFLIRGDEVIITRYDSEINLAKGKYGVHNLKSPGTWNENYLKDWCNQPNLLEYASSRKVTATSDVEVDPPRYSPVEEEEPDVEPTTTAKPTQTKTTTVTHTTTTTVAASSTVPTTSITVTTTETKVMHDCVMPDEDGEEEGVSAPPAKSFPVGLVLGIGGGAVLAVGVAIVILLYKRKKK